MSHRNTINIWFFSDTNWWHGSRKKYHTKNFFVNSRWSVWTFTKKKEFPVKNRTNISDVSEEFHDLLQNRIGEVRILSEVRSYFHCGIDIKVRLTRRPGPFAWQFKFFSWQKGHFFRRMMFSLFSSLFKRNLNCMIALVNSMYQK